MPIQPVSYKQLHNVNKKYSTNSISNYTNRANLNNNTDIISFKSNDEKYSDDIIESICQSLHIDYKQNEDKLFTISRFHIPYDYNDTNINWDLFFKSVKEIEENANFFTAKSRITSLGNLEKIGGDADFSFTPISNLGNLRSIGGNANFGGFRSKITSLGKLETIGKDAYFQGSKISNVGNLKEIGGFVFINKSSVLKAADFKNITDKIFDV